MQNSLKAVGQLLSGEIRSIQLLQHCLRQDGTSAAFRCVPNVFLMCS